MDSPSISFATSPSAVPPGAALPLQSGGADPLRGADFANLFKHLMDPAGRQGLAAATELGFQSLPLSPNIDVITADQPLPDNASLLAFARSQGLDDGMLNTLFAPGQPGADAQALAGLATLGQAGAGSVPGQPPQLVVQAVDLPASPAAEQAAALGQMALTQGQVVVQELSVSRLPGAALAQAAPTAAAVLAAGLGGRPAADPALAGPAGLVLARSAAAVATALGEAVQGEPDVAAAAVHLGLPLARPAKTSGLSTALPTAADLAALATADTEADAVRASAQAAAAQTAGQAMQEGLRLRLQPPDGISQRLAAMAASGEQALWGQISNQVAGDTEVLVLGLGADGAAIDALPGEASALPHSSNAAPLSDTQRASLGSASQAAASQPASTAADRVAQYEQLAQRLGQALGERLQSQIERGEWKVRMQVDPASLGRIEMELDMRAGGLDAVFRSENQATRDLIAQGLPRLRETLSQAGTAVANVWVQGDSSRQSGGNPTPWRGAKPGQTEGQDEGDVKAIPVTASRTRADGSDWDLMA